MNLTKTSSVIKFCILLIGVFVSLQPQSAHAQVASPNVAKITLTFDDGLASHLVQAAPVLKKYSLSGTEYVTTGCIGMTKAPNSCHANNDHVYMTWAQVKSLKSTYGWEIGSHTITHPYMASSDASDGQPNKLIPLQVSLELSQSKAALAAQGLPVTQYASPYGDYSYQTLAEVAKYYQTNRGFWDQNANVWPYNNYIMNVMQVQSGVTVAQVKAKIDEAVANKQWLILVFHDIKVTPSTDPTEYDYKTSDLDQIASYIKTKQTAGVIRPTSIEQGMKVSLPNLLTNNSFTNGIASGWVSGNATSVVRDTSTNGSFPSPKDSVKFVGNTKAGHLFSPAVPANPNATYAVKAFVNTLAKTAGEFGFYVDEYDAAGNWTSGKWLGAVWLPTVSHFTASYTPTSANVVSFKLQTYMSAGSAGTVYADEFELYNTNSTQPTAIPTPIATATPAPTVATPTAGPILNLVPNPSFETVAGDFAAQWEKDSPSFTVDTTSKGSAGANSMKLSPNPTDSHLFSAKIPVDARSTYKWQSNVKALSGAGEFGFYIDQYDDAGNWQGGQWKGMIAGPFSGVKEFTYAASVPTVTNVRLQYYAVPNSSLTLYLDNVVFGK